MKGNYNNENWCIIYLIIIALIIETIVKTMSMVINKDNNKYSMQKNLLFNANSIFKTKILIYFH